ncbi:unnamed protein product [Periconia digitata]|uniref:amidase n=1 Tax=Periconia digitata TaxID=1303443 RepID=A0A9W4USA6_9PLEO|nr:unnamed protein product [Periconia digitata]
MGGRLEVADASFIIFSVVVIYLYEFGCFRCVFSLLFELWTLLLTFFFLSGIPSFGLVHWKPARVNMTTATQEPASQTWETVASKHCAQLLAKIPQEYIIPQDIFPSQSQSDATLFRKSSGWFTENELEITSSDACAILEKLKTSKWSSEEVTRAFCKTAAAAHQLTNCLTDFFPGEAIARAKSLDEHLARTGNPKGPLHGLPISLKDNFNVEGKDSTIGFVSLVAKPATANATLVDVLQDLGAVYFVKTTTPTAMMIAETTSNLFPVTKNPLNLHLTPGGSSGGEAALLAFNASPLGIGTDIGGSLRIPASCTGLFTLRPSLGRFPTQGCTSGMGGQEAVASVNGPMARELRDVEMYCRTVVSAEPWRKDPKCIPIPWREQHLPKTLKIAVCWADGVVKPTPPVTRALHETVSALKAAGHDIVEWDPTLHAQGLALLARMFVADGGKSIEKLLAPAREPWRPEMAMYEAARELGVYDMWQLHLERSTFQKKFLEQWMRCAGGGGIDAILAPTTPYAGAPAHGKFKYVGYTGVFNVVDYSAVSFPSGLVVDKEKDKRTDASNQEPLSDYDREVQSSYDVDLAHGMPISLQLVANRLEEEKALAITRAIIAALHQ